MCIRDRREPLEDEVNVNEVLREIKGDMEDFVITQDEEGTYVIEGRILDEVLAKYVITTVSYTHLDVYKRQDFPIL